MYIKRHTAIVTPCLVPTCRAGRGWRGEWGHLLKQAISGSTREHIRNDNWRFPVFKVWVVSTSRHCNPKSSFGILFIRIRREEKKWKNPSISGFRDLLQALNKIKVKSITRDNLGTDGLTETKEKQNKVTVWSADRVLKGTCLSTGSSLVGGGNDWQPRPTLSQEAGEGRLSSAKQDCAS